MRKNFFVKLVRYMKNVYHLERGLNKLTDERQLRIRLLKTEPLTDILWLLSMEQNSSGAIRKAVQNA
ncbi:MAG: hypothetical protein VR66_20025 [Peptococcaceae bacterium BRH_c23]|nr:MAG: hypothetical protein VR66_20025 [Peptococcaceae bacterium BRH_c23]KJS88519.1 MAG: hypothetical protein JL57_11905 [Desulfosporosinus sp. BICA1-9]HBW35158.1 hypothetical protein [Desulfosporosinus sp.]